VEGGEDADSHASALHAPETPAHGTALIQPIDCLTVPGDEELRNSACSAEEADEHDGELIRH